MKFLEDEKLALLTAELTDALLGTGERKISGRIEAFTMKRAGTDKKYAHALGEKYEQEIQVIESEIAQFHRSIQRSRSESLSYRHKASQTLHGRSKYVVDSKRKKGGGIMKASRNRSSSFDDMFYSTSSYIESPLGDFHYSCTRRLMTDLVLTLNASFPDYDFSNVHPSHFIRLPAPSSAINHINERLSEFAATSLSKGVSFLPKLWKGIDNAIVLAESTVYSYVPPNRDDDDPLGFLTQTLDAADAIMVVPLWTFNFFFVNKSLKRIVCFTCVQTVRNESGVSFVGDYEHSYNASGDFKESSGILSDAFHRETSSIGGGYTDSNISSENEDGVTVDDFDMESDGMGQAIPAPSNCCVAR